MARAVMFDAVARAARLGAVVLAAGTLAACGGTTAPAPPATHSAAERSWLDNAGRFIETLDSDITLSADGGANLATARRALTDESSIYGMLVAYTDAMTHHSARALLAATRLTLATAPSLERARTQLGALR